MFQTMIRGFKTMLLAAGLVTLMSTGSFAEDPFAVTGVHVVAAPVHQQGQCPATITFTATIMVNHAGTVWYSWIRSDKARGPRLSLKFTHPGEQTVTTTWRLGGPGLREYHGWEAIRIIGPNRMESNHAMFDLRCDK
jgi:hypothetical protein